MEVGEGTDRTVIDLEASVGLTGDLLGGLDGPRGLGGLGGLGGGAFPEKLGCSSRSRGLYTRP